MRYTPDWMVHVWDARNRREKLLLLAVAVIVATMLGWYGVAAPLRRMALAAEAHQANAARQLAQVEAAVKEIATQSVAQHDIADGGGFGDAVSRSATNAGLTFDTQRAENASELTVSARAVEPAILFGWIGKLRQDHGIVVTNLTVTRNQDGGLKMEARLARGGQ